MVSNILRFNSKNIVSHNEMLSAINVPKSKSITIAFTSLKSMILGQILTSVYISLVQSECSKNNTSTTLYKLFFLLGMVLDILCLIYFFCKHQFNRLEYYVFYIFHVVLAVLSLVMGGVSYHNQSCQIIHMYASTCVFINFIFLATSFIVMYANLYFALKFAHLGSNIIWTYMWSIHTKCDHFFSFFIAFTHAFMSAVGFICFVVMRGLGKTQNTAKCWRVIYYISILSMLLCYLVMLFGLTSANSCSSSSLFEKTYLYYGLLEFLSPILLLIFLDTEMGDPRTIIIRKNATNVFIYNRQNINFEVDDIN